MPFKLFFRDPVLQGQLRHQMLELLVLLPYLGNLNAIGLTNCVSLEPLLAGLEEVLAPTIVEVRADTLPAAQG